MAEKYILLIEDNPDEVLLTERAIDLCKMPAKLVVAYNGQEAVDLLFGSLPGQNPEKKIAIILLDLNLPMIDGLEVLERIMTDTNTSKIPVIVLSSSIDEKDVDESYRLGAREYIRKPTSFSEFVDAMHNILSRWMGADGTYG